MHEEAAIGLLDDYSPILDKDLTYTPETGLDEPQSVIEQVPNAFRNRRTPSPRPVLELRSSPPRFIQTSPRRGHIQRHGTASRGTAAFSAIIHSQKKLSISPKTESQGDMESTGVSQANMPQSTTASRPVDPANRSVRNAQSYGYNSRPQQPTFGRAPYWQTWPEVTILAKKLPAAWNTLDVYGMASKYGNITSITLNAPSVLEQTTTATVRFRPPPKNAKWIANGLLLHSPTGIAHTLEFEVLKQLPRDQSLAHSHQTATDRPVISCTGLEFAMWTGSRSLAVMNTVPTPPQGALELEANMHRKTLELKFWVALQLADRRPQSGKTLCLFRVDLPFAKLRSILVTCTADNGVCLSIPLSEPPRVFRRAQNIAGTHDPGSRHWDERQAWFRQTTIAEEGARDAEPVQVAGCGATFDIGRWLVYRLHLSRDVTSSQTFSDILKALVDHNITISRTDDLEVNGKPTLYTPLSLTQTTGAVSQSLSSLLDMQQMQNDLLHIPDRLAYQLQVCISQQKLSEHMVGADFTRQLLNMELVRAVKVLEKVADSKQPFFDPLAVFAMAGQVSAFEKRVPKHCATIRSAIITPTTMYVSTPSIETSNRVLRKYSECEDRFLRVRFMEEKSDGRLWSCMDETNDEVYTRVKRVMMKGIVIGDRHYEFLAFGNSQFREHGAYFFASTHVLTAAMIRAWMGTFTQIKVVAKYASRVGQCFSTTRAITSIGVSVRKIPDVTRNGYTFTDGVGKISTLLAALIANEFKLPNAATDYPSLFQFRLAGCKGVLAVDPSVKGQEVCIRPSQEKFPATYLGLEIVRVSGFTTAYLNQQIILVLSALGVETKVFLRKLETMVQDLNDAMHDETKALRLLQKNIDFNQMTVTMAGMIIDGFMAASDPFMMSLLNLWRAWSIKFLKEKARIVVDQGAFVFGCVDETATLSGHFDTRHDQKWSAQDPEGLPEIFLQIPDPAQNGVYKVVEGVCILGRNPSLHPGDIRIVRAIDVPALHHLKNVVVLPQTGERDLANMCSGGDLDGDDYFVIWDDELLPKEWNHPPMDYSPPPPVESDGPITTDAITSFFVSHIKHDNLGSIATAHRAWADLLDGGVKEDRCIELAHLHSRAVDFVKTGVPAIMPKYLKPDRWPHWMERKSGRKAHSRKVLGVLYDAVKEAKFEAAWDSPFDHRILSAYTVTDRQLADAAEVKQEYDAAMYRIMAQYGIRTEVEVFSTFVLQNNQQMGSYKLAESFGEIMNALKQRYQEMCYIKAGTTVQERDWEKLAPFLTAMYTVTANDVASAVDLCRHVRVVGGQEQPMQTMQSENMPLMSFPWIFAKELGQIATNMAPVLKQTGVQESKLTARKAKYGPLEDILSDPGEDGVYNLLPAVQTEEGITHAGDLLDIYHQDDPDTRESISMNVSAMLGSSSSERLPPRQTTDSILDYTYDETTTASPKKTSDLSRTNGTGAALAGSAADVRTPEDAPLKRSTGQTMMDPDCDDASEFDQAFEGEEVKIDTAKKPAALDALAGMVGV